MNLAIQHFQTNIDKVKDLGGLYTALQSLTTDAIDKSDLLRSQLVLGVSALDFYVHEITYYGILEVFDGLRTPTSAYEKFQVPVSVISASTRSSFANIVQEKHSYLSFQQPDKIADAIRLFSDIRLWDNVAGHMGRSTQNLKIELKQIVDRRNKIAHEADIDPSYPNTRWPITQLDVNSAIDFLEDLAKAIHTSVV